MEKRDFVYEGKAKKVWTTSDPNLYVVEYKNSLTAFNALKKDTVEGKGRLNNLISASLFRYLSGMGVPTHFVELLDDLHQVVKKVAIVPIEVVVRNITTGTLCKRLGVEEGKTLPVPWSSCILRTTNLVIP